MSEASAGSARNEPRRLTLIACCGAHSVQDGLGAVLYVLLPVLAQSLGLSYAQVGVIRAANHGAMMALEIPSGLLAERFGERGLLGFGLLCAALGFFFLAASGGFVGAVMALTIAGVGAAFQHALCSSLISQAYADGTRRTALGTYNSFGDVGKLTFAGLFGLLLGFASWPEV
nr:MFS transporter [Gammaproteobacteria bacterium]